MTDCIPNCLSEDIIQYILQQPEVIAAKEKLEAQTAGSISFTVTLTPSMQSYLHEKMNINLTGIDTIPMRWIKGDTHPHTDKGVSSFEKTHLVYLTDSIGQLVVDGTSYPIAKGNGYVFSEGLPHETVETGSESRLLLGPMNESGLAVGASQGFYLNPGQTGYIRQVGANIQYSVDQVNWSILNRTQPFILTNLNPARGYVYVTILTDLTIDNPNTYLQCASANIQIGRRSLQSNGTRPVIVINTSNYDGFIANGDIGVVGYNEIYVYNLVVDGHNGSLQLGAGWLCKKGYGNTALYNYIVNCSSIGDTPGSGSGGLVGSYACKGNGTQGSAGLGIRGCSSSGVIGNSDGGIIGQYAATNGGRVDCKGCWTTGFISSSAGGIFGAFAGAVTSGKGGIAVANTCYTTGNIDQSGGGIFGIQAGSGTSSITAYALATICYSQGAIGDYGGGIMGRYAASSGGEAEVSNSYSSGTIGSSSGGIYGANYGTASVSSNCYTCGLSSGGAIGGIYSNSSSDNPASYGTNNYSQANNGNSGNWTTSNAQATLQNAPVPPRKVNVWVATQLNTPYEIRDIGYTPYALEIINYSTPTLINTNSQTISVGGNTIPAIVPDKSYEILEIVSSLPSPYTTISINSTTGVISTTSATTVGSYTVYVRNTGSYYISSVTLTVIPFISSSGIPPCCQPVCPQYNQTTNNTQEERSVRQASIAIASDVDSTYAAINQNRPVQFLQPAFKTYRDYMTYLQSKYR
jgi:hypothetical protein